MDKIVLEQVYQALPTPVKAWLMRTGPSLLTQATAYLENYFLAELAVQPEAGAPD